MATKKKAELLDNLCASCGTALEPAWAFCGRCGAAIPADDESIRADGPLLQIVSTTQDHHDEAPTTSQVRETAASEVLPAPSVPAVVPATEEDAPPAAHPVESGRRRPWRIVLLAAVVAMALATASILLLNEVGTHDRLARTRQQLASTSSKLRDTATELATTQSTLMSTQSDLATRTTERDSARSQLSDVQNQLAGVKGTLSDAQSRVNLQSGQLTILKTCLAGVSTALDDNLNSDYSGALSALIAVESSCKQASQIAAG